MREARGWEHMALSGGTRFVAPKVAAYGGSYGGFVVLSALATRPDLWCCGIDVVGIVNFVSFLERTGPYRRSHREAEYGSLERDREMLAAFSPIAHVDRICSPLLVLHGANDPRVPLYEAEQLVEALRARGVPVQVHVYADEGHGIAKLANRLHAYPKMAAFLEQYLLDSRAAADDADCEPNRALAPGPGPDHHAYDHRDAYGPGHTRAARAQLQPVDSLTDSQTEAPGPGPWASPPAPGLVQLRTRSRVFL